MIYDEIYWDKQLKKIDSQTRYEDKQYKMMVLKGKIIRIVTNLSDSDDKNDRRQAYLAAKSLMKNTFKNKVQLSKECCVKKDTIYSLFEEFEGEE